MIYQYSNFTPQLSRQTSIFIFFSLYPSLILGGRGGQGGQNPPPPVPCSPASGTFISRLTPFSVLLPSFVNWQSQTHPSHLASQFLSISFVVKEFNKITTAICFTELNEVFTYLFIFFEFHNFSPFSSALQICF